MPATNRLRHVAQWQNCPMKPPDIVAARESAFGTSLHSLRRKIRSLLE
jgi:hypothetical protein